MSFWDKVKATASDIGEKTKEEAIKLKVLADKELERAKQSEAWAKTKQGTSEAWTKTKEGSQKAWVDGQVVARNVGNQAQTAIKGKTNTVTFNEAKLGMTLARDENSGQAIVSRVDQDGAAALMGIICGDKIISMRGGFPDDGTGEPSIKVESYDHLMGLFPAMGRPVSITFQTPRDGAMIPSAGVVNYSMEEEVEKATKILTKLTTERASNPDALIPLDILRRARGLAFIRIAKIGFGFSVKMGTGIVLARLGDSLDSWSAPCAIGTAGVGMGFQWGAELTDFMIVLNTQEAVEAFASGNQVSLGGNIGIAVGPVGRNAGVSGNIHGGDLAFRDGRAAAEDEGADGAGGEGGRAPKPPVKVAPCYAYSHSKGLFIGISLEGAVIKPRKEVNAKFYGPDIDSRLILSGSTPPPALAEPLYDLLASASVDDDAQRSQFSSTSAAENSMPITSEPHSQGQQGSGGEQGDAPDPAYAAAYAAANPFNDGDGSNANPDHAQRFGQMGDEDSTEML